MDIKGKWLLEYFCLESKLFCLFFDFEDNINVCLDKIELK